MNIAGIEYITVVDHNRAIAEKSFRIEELKKKLSAAQEDSARIEAELTQEIKDLRQELEDANIHVGI